MFIISGATTSLIAFAKSTSKFFEKILTVFFGFFRSLSAFGEIVDFFAGESLFLEAAFFCVTDLAFSGFALFVTDLTDFTLLGVFVSFLLEDLLFAFELDAGFAFFFGLALAVAFFRAIFFLTIFFFVAMSICPVTAALIDGLFSLTAIEKVRRFSTLLLSKHLIGNDLVQL
jgi:hypothetical protein